MSYHLTPVRLDISNNQEIVELLRMWKEGTLALLRMQIVSFTVEASMEIPQKSKQNYHMIQPFYLWLYTHRNQKQDIRDIYHIHFITTLVKTAKIWKEPKYQSTNERIKKMWCMNTQYKIIQP